MDLHSAAASSTAGSSIVSIPFPPVCCRHSSGAFNRGDSPSAAANSTIVSIPFPPMFLPAVPHTRQEETLNPVVAVDVSHAIQEETPSSSCFPVQHPPSGSLCAEQAFRGSSVSKPMRKRRSAGEINHQEDLQQEDDDAMRTEERVSSSSEEVWKEDEHPRKQVSSMRAKHSGRISRKLLRRVFQNNSKLSRLATTDDYIRMNRSKLLDVVKPLVNKELKTLDLSNLKARKRADEYYDLFQEVYIRAIDKKLASFLDITFSSLDEAISSLNIVIRSYISGFCVHRWQSYKVANESNRFIVNCHTRTHKKIPRNEEGVKERNCSWSAIIEYDNKSAHFIRISSFTEHSKNCFLHLSRMTPNEVTVRSKIPSNHLNGVLTKLRQDWAAKKALYMRNYRLNCAVKALTDEAFVNSLTHQQIYESISNFKECLVEPDDDVKLILRYLSFLLLLLLMRTMIYVWQH